MALFSRKSKTTDASAAVKTETKSKKTKAVAVAERATSGTGSATYAKKHRLGSIILSPRITEKATVLNGMHNAYVFNIHKDATKGHVTQAVRTIYNVQPVRVTIAKTPAKQVFKRGKRGKTSGVKKAYVYLKEGDKIEFI